MIKAILKSLCLGAMLAKGGIASATETKTLFSYKLWVVKVVAFDDAQLKCMAQVSAGNSSFSIWADGDNPARVQFYNPAWELGQSYADVKVNIDRQPTWNMPNATLNKNSVLYDLPNNNYGRRFLFQVRAGQVIYLSNSTGRQVGRWSLAGSSAAIGALIDCVDLVRTDHDDNPFN